MKLYAKLSFYILNLLEPYVPLGVVATVEGGTDVVATVVSSAEGVVSTVVPGTV